MEDLQMTTQSEISKFADCVFDPADIVEIRRLPSRQSTWHTASDLPQQADTLAAENEAGQNIYCGANPRNKTGGTKAEDVALARCLVADFDGIDAVAAIARIIAAGLPKPTLLLNSGRGAHAYWRLAEPMSHLNS